MHGTLQSSRVPTGAIPQVGIVAVTSGPFLWHMGCASWGGTQCGLSFGCPVLLCMSLVWKPRDLKEGKALSQPWVDPKAQPKGLGCCRLRCDGVSMDYGTRSGVGTGGGGV